jgi:glycosyltransferase involved in cell wall biosynthesis
MLIRTDQEYKTKDEAAHPEASLRTGSLSMDAFADDTPILGEVLFLTTYPPRQCGIATYSHDLMGAIKEKFGASFSYKVCAIEASGETLHYPEEVKYVLASSDLSAYEELAAELNFDSKLSTIFVQHEFGLFGGDYGDYLLGLLCLLNKPVVTTFHTILPQPDQLRKKVVQTIAMNSVSVISMTFKGAEILEKEYGIPAEKIRIIPHGTHLVSSFDHTEKMARHHLGNRMVLSTFGLISPGKSIETALDALPAIVDKFPNVLYLIIGKTHPGITKHHGEEYREMLEQKVVDLNLQGHVRFINKYLSLKDLLGYLQRTDIYLFTSKDPYQVVSGTFAYAMGCGCPVISTPIPHAKEFLQGAGVIVDFQRPDQMADAAVKLLSDPGLMREMKLNALHKIRPTAWPNAALSHMKLVSEISTSDENTLKYSLPPISLSHIRKMTTTNGIIQFSKLSSPDIHSGYTLDDNARALIAGCWHYKISRDKLTRSLVEIYLDFIITCQSNDGSFLNYVDADGSFHDRNQQENLEDSNGRALWALGEFIAHGNMHKKSNIKKAEVAFLTGLNAVKKMRSPRAISFVIKGLYQYNRVRETAAIKDLIISLADDLANRYRSVSDKKWKWFEEYLTYANSVIPEALLYAYLSSGNKVFKTIAKSSFNFLLGVIFKDDEIKVVSNQGWFKKGKRPNRYGEQPIDVAYTVLALDRFSKVFPEEGYRMKMESAFNWFLGKNHLRQIVYNPVTGGCYDGLEEHHINLNQGAESTVSYLMARLAMETNAMETNLNKSGNTKLLIV